jgi:serine/threonine protein kinase
VDAPRRDGFREGADMAIPKPNLSTESQRVLELWLTEFDQSWHVDLLAMRVRVLPPAGDPLRLAALSEMVRLDQRRQWENGRQRGIEEYLKTYPELGSPDTVSADLLLADYEVRQRFGEPTDLMYYAQRFPRQVDELRRLMESSGRRGPVADAAQPSTGTAPPLHSTEAANPPAQPPGRMPDQVGRYRIIKKLGQGGMGAVYLAHDTQLDRAVALKVPHFGPDAGPQMLERFYREARAAATIHHPNLCPVYDVGESQGIHYLTMAYIEGKPLSDYIQTGRMLPQRQVAAVVRRVALALHEAHSRGIIHRDLKPANIMINQRHEPIIMDFGLARRSNKDDVRLTRSGALVGTPAYMAPEQMSGETEALGPSCDIYSLGVILYEMLTGQLPFHGNAALIVAQVLTQEPPPASTRRPDLDRQLEAICLKAMARHVAERYPSMEALATALSSYLRSTGQPSAHAESPSAKRPGAGGGSGRDRAAGVPMEAVAAEESLLLLTPSPDPPVKDMATQRLSTVLPAADRNRLWLWLVGAGGMVLLGLVGVVAAVMLVVLSPAKKTVSSVEEEPDDGMIVPLASQNNLKQLALAMHSYHDVYGRLPPAVFYNDPRPGFEKKEGPGSKPLLSWRVALLPFLEQQPLCEQFHLDEPWDSPHNKPLLSRMPKVYAPAYAGPQQPYTTYYQVFTGPAAPFPESPFEGRSSATFIDFSDGTANTFLIVEAWKPVPWTKPEDISYGADRPLPKLGGMYRDGFHASAADGSIHFIPRDTPESTIRALITHQGAEIVEWPDLKR